MGDQSAELSVTLAAAVRLLLVDHYDTLRQGAAAGAGRVGTVWRRAAPLLKLASGSVVPQRHPSDAMELPDVAAPVPSVEQPVCATGNGSPDVP